MKAFLVLTRIRVLYILRSPVSAGYFLAFPVVLLVVLGLVFANGHPFDNHVIAIVDGSDDALAPSVTALRGHEGVRVVHARDRADALGQLHSRMVAAVLVIERGGPRLLVAPQDELLGRGLATALPVEAPVEVVRVPRFGYVHYLFPGVITFSAFIAGLFGMGYAMVRFRESRFLKKLATTPMSKGTFVLANVTARALLVFMQVALIVVAGVVLFGVPISGPALAWLTLITALGIVTFLGAGFALAAAIKTEELMVDTISAINFPMILLSELFFPVEVMVEPLPTVAAILPTTQMVRLTRDVLLHGQTDPAVLLPGLAIMLGWAVLTFGVAMSVFRWHR